MSCPWRTAGRENGVGSDLEMRGCPATFHQVGPAGLQAVSESQGVLKPALRQREGRANFGIAGFESRAAATAIIFFRGDSSPNPMSLCRMKFTACGR